MNSENRIARLERLLLELVRAELGDSCMMQNEQLKAIEKELTPDEP